MDGWREKTLRGFVVLIACCGLVAFVRCSPIVSCKSDGDCLADQVCESDRTCRPKCQSNSDCLSGQKCQSNGACRSDGVPGIPDQQGPTDQENPIDQETLSDQRKQPDQQKQSDARTDQHNQPEPPPQRPDVPPKRLGQAFQAQAAQWSVPKGGDADAGIWNVTGQSRDIGDLNWVTMDLNGDGKPDLVQVAEVTKRSSGGFQKRVFGFESAPHWRVYLSNGKGFDSRYTKWSVPKGGDADAGIWNVTGQSRDIGDLNWVTMDLNGDGKPDLVQHAEVTKRSSGGFQKRVFGFESAPHWRVYLNNGRGFDSRYIKWPVPKGGDADAGIWNVTGQSRDVGDLNWVTMDLNGDGKPDLVQHAEVTKRSSGGYQKRVFGFESAPHWRVHLNNGKGFDSRYTKWPVPKGGDADAGIWNVTGQSRDVGDLNWVTMDLNGDGKPDLVQHAELVKGGAVGYLRRVFGFESAPHWRVYLNNGKGFDSRYGKWSVPKGGSPVSGHWSVTGNNTAVGDMNWVTMDLNGDGKPDLVQHAEVIKRSSGGYQKRVFGFESAPHWRVYLSNGKGFEVRYIKWSVPKGGDADAGIWNVTGQSRDIGDLNWVTMDLNGDGKPDLVQHAEVTKRSSGGFQKRVFGFESAPHWRVFFTTP